MKTVIIKYTFNDDFCASRSETEKAVEMAFDALEILCGCGVKDRACSLEIGSCQWVEHDNDEFVDHCVAKLEDIEDE